jgi:hypothetical protein
LIKRDLPLRYFKSKPSDFNRAVQNGLNRGRSWSVDLGSYGGQNVPIRVIGDLIWALGS